MLKNEKFTFNGETVTLNELSALQRIDFLQYLVIEEKFLHKEDEDDNARSAAITEMNIRSAARVVAMSLWQNDRKGPTVDDLQQEVLETWSPTAIGEADIKIKILSGMIRPAEQENGGQASKDNENVEEQAPSLEKS